MCESKDSKGSPADSTWTTPTRFSVGKAADRATWEQASRIVGEMRAIMPGPRDASRNGRGPSSQQPMASAKFIQLVRESAVDSAYLAALWTRFSRPMPFLTILSETASAMQSHRSASAKDRRVNSFRVPRGRDGRDGGKDRYRETCMSRGSRCPRNVSRGILRGRQAASRMDPGNIARILSATVAGAGRVGGVAGRVRPVVDLAA